MKIFNVIIVFCFLLTSCVKKYDQRDFILDKHKALKSTKKIEKLLNQTIDLNDNKRLNNIIEEWHSSVLPNCEESISNSEITIQLFKLFYLSYTDASKIFNDNKTSKYTIIQNQLKYGITKFENLKVIDPEAIKLDKISNFRPRVDNNIFNVLYAIPEYKTAFEKHIIMRDSINFNYNVKQNEHDSILKNLCPISWDMVKRESYLCVDPLFNSIIFNKSLTKARVDCTLLNYMGYALIYSKKGEKWILKETFETWTI
jgi:hypothetical protein